MAGVAEGFPPRSIVQYYFYGWRDQRIWRRINLATRSQPVWASLDGRRRKHRGWSRPSFEGR
jgi:hypothetical protein